MLSKRWIIGGAVVLLLIGGFFILSENKIFSFSKGKGSSVDSLEMMEKLTPQIADLSNQLKNLLKMPTYISFGQMSISTLEMLNTRYSTIKKPIRWIPPMLRMHWV